MALTRLDIIDFRNLSCAKICPTSSGVNLFYGRNGSGKTSILEAIYYLSLGRSFRSLKSDRIINHDSEKLSLFAQIVNGNQKTSLGLERNQQSDLKIRVANQDVNSIVELAALLPVLLINSHCHHFLDAGPQYRRKYLDWGIFHQSPAFLSHWRDYHRVLKQRNAALKSHLPRREVSVWTEKLLSNALYLDQIRQEYVKRLLPCLLELVKDMLPQVSPTISYFSGWTEGMDYAELLEQSFPKDAALGYTQFGPHRADLKVMLMDCPAKDILSRGQQKLFVCAMIIAQGLLLQTGSNKRPIYLIDDLPSELDDVSRSKVMDLISKQETQVFVTAVERNILDLTQPIAKMFHVEHGDVTEDQNVE